MSGSRTIRVSGLSGKSFDISSLRDYFEDESNGGGPIEKIYFPSKDETAVIVYENHEAVERITTRSHRIKFASVTVQEEPYMVYVIMKAVLDPDIASVISSTGIKSLLEQYTSVSIETKSQTVLSGNWYDLEMAWHIISNAKKEQFLEQFQIQCKNYREQKKPLKDQNELSDQFVNTDMISGSLSLSKKQKTSEGKTRQESSELNSDIESYQKYKTNKNSKGKEHLPFLNQTKEETHRSKSLSYKNKSLNSVSKITTISDDHSKSKKCFAKSMDSKLPSDAYIKKSDLGEIQPGILNIESGILKGATYIVRNRNTECKSPLSSENMEFEDSDVSMEETPSTPIKRFQDEDETCNKFSSPYSVSSLGSASKKLEKTADRYDLLIGNIKISMRRADIVKATTAGIVSAANGSLINGGGVAGAISRAVGRKLQKECDDLIQKNGPLGVASVVHTTAGGKLDENVVYILHAVGPIRAHTGLEKEGTELALLMTYINALEYAELLWLDSVTFPCISSGIFGFPLEISVQCFLYAVLMHLDHAKHLKELHMVNSDTEFFPICMKLIQSLGLDKGIETACQEAKKELCRLIQVCGEKEYKKLTLNKSLKSERLCSTIGATPRAKTILPSDFLLKSASLHHERDQSPASNHSQKNTSSIKKSSKR